VLRPVAGRLPLVNHHAFGTGHSGVLELGRGTSPASLGRGRLAAALGIAAAGLNPAFALDLPRTADVVLDVYNVAGRKIGELEKGRLGPGQYRFPSQGSPGVYYPRPRSATRPDGAP
jgi:hypothetical protein